MNLPCKILASFLLICNIPTKGAFPAKVEITCGILDHDVNLTISDFPMNDSIDDIRWYIAQTKTKIGQFRKGKDIYQLNETYHIFSDGTLQIKNLTRNSNGTYQVMLFDIHGKNVLERTIDLRILDEVQIGTECSHEDFSQERAEPGLLIPEMVSKPVISWKCINRTLTCEVMNGSDTELKLYLNNKPVNTSHQNIITHEWPNYPNPSFSCCVAKNEVLEETCVANISCTENGLNISLIISITGGGIILIIFVALLIFCISKKRKQSTRRNVNLFEI
ncbi:T-cell surface antigen CD2 isoform 3-T3 [Trichechus inunguis]|uniref:T-cell surface antigen CD2 n=1 Tax=Trichechus manatus latirostris TaxID=127582 RepID=A0A2Y9R591_TRIMA|nr:T-cell surface antigen CD2 isoform X3 [Trichechus manatus latirostris]